MSKLPRISGVLFKRSIVLGLGAVAVLLSAQSAGAAVFGRDDRTRAKASDARAAASIGRLTSSHSGALCSAFCVGPDVIVTASHCITGGPMVAASPLGKIHFALGTLSGRGVGIRGSQTATQAQNISIGTRHLKLTPPINASEDWALLRLAAPVCPKQSLPLTTRNRADVETAMAQDRVYQIAFHGDTRERALQRSSDCGAAASVRTGSAALTAEMFERDFSDATAILFHGCDTGGGSSGSPLLLDGDAGPEVVGLNVGTYVVTRATPGAPSGAVEPSAVTATTEAIANTAIDVSQFRLALAELSARDSLADPNDMRALSRHLREQGFYQGPASGRFSTALDKAIRRFEASRGRAVTGQPLRALLNQLRAER